MEQQKPASQKLPLAGVLNPEEKRDSAYFSSTDPSSKREWTGARPLQGYGRSREETDRAHDADTSTTSCAGVPAFGPPSAGFQSSQPDKTPSPISTVNFLSQALVSPATSNMSVASMVSPTTPGSADPRRLGRPQSLGSAPNSATLAAAEHDPISRRESVDSRINQGFGEMRLGSSPYASHNQSTTSIHSTLQQQRNPRPGLDNLAVHRISNGYQPSADRNPDGNPKVIRTAPAITGPAISHIARAAEPTKGQAWAFPEEEIQRMPSAANQSLVDSRRSSVADSIASSQYTSESRLPPGQRRQDESLSAADNQRLSSASGEYPTTHHHALQQRQLGDLHGEAAGSPAGSQPYSRTPELRMSHKLAERKRRTEMIELFEQLRDLMPQERGSKASKWEILTKGEWQSPLHTTTH